MNLLPFTIYLSFASALLVGPFNPLAAQWAATLATMR
jgi:hypothetical protein